MRRTVTLEDVAKLSGVSMATVSRVVNGKKNVSEATRRRVEEAIRKLDYRPHTVARNLATGRTSSILLYIVHEDPIEPSTWSYELPIVQGVCDYLHTTSFELQVKMCSSTQFQQPGFLSTSLKRQSFDGVLVLASWMLNRYDAVELRKERIPFVLIGCRDADGFAPSIEANNEAIVRELVGRLAAQGHSNFALLGGEESQLHMCDRYSGFRLGLEDHGILLRKNLVLHGDWTVESGYRLMRRLLMEEPKPTAANDLLRPLPPQVEVYGWHTFEHRADFWRYQNRHCARLRGVRL
jgi:LacI family transcriptional regulator